MNAADWNYQLMEYEDWKQQQEEKEKNESEANKNEN